nr:hypothetical protein BaRGS_008287 [Batillaria attramentaria]
MPDLCRTSLSTCVLYEETECYWQLLSHGISLNDIWPVNCEENPYSNRNKITKMTIQAANGEALTRPVLYVIQNFPTDLYDDVFKFSLWPGAWRVVLDAGFLRVTESVSNPAPLPPQDLLGHWFLSRSLPQLFVPGSSLAIGC